MRIEAGGVLGGTESKILVANDLTQQVVCWVEVAGCDGVTGTHPHVDDDGGWWGVVTVTVAATVARLCWLFLLLGRA